MTGGGSDHRQSRKFPASRGRSEVRTVEEAAALQGPTSRGQTPHRHSDSSGRLPVARGSFGLRTCVRKEMVSSWNWGEGDLPPRAVC